MNKDRQPRFTVIIPTKDRAEYLKHTLRTCALQDYDNLEILVSDDGSTDQTREVVEEAGRKDPRIRYVTPGGCVGMRDNFEFALDQVKPGFVIAMGGDDGILPYGVSRLADFLLETGLELAAWPAPMFSYAKARMETGQLVLHRPRKSRIVESSIFLARQVETLNYIADIESPMFYVKGVASTRLVDQVRRRSPEGRFYVCPTPDGYSGIVLAGEVERFAFSGEAYTIYGTSPTSQGLGYLANDQEAKKRSDDFFKHVSAVPMHPELAGQPYSPLITVMTVDYLLTARDLPGWPGRFPEISMSRMLEKSLAELAHGLYGGDRVLRELRILDQIAGKHGLRDEFRRMVQSTRRFAAKSPFEGDGISSDRVFIDCTRYGIHDLFDAAYAAYCLGNLAEKATPGSIARAFAGSVAYRLRSLRKGEPFPGPASWSEGEQGVD
ncbi:glycosyltransferase family 2 protein [Mesoterricola sediminis]|nr:glycosyltransferase family A protein [Mesoterricola sediminis]